MHEDNCPHVHGYVVGQGKNILIMFSGDCGYISLDATPKWQLVVSHRLVVM